MAGEDAGEAAGLLRPAPDSTLKTWPVSPRVNSPRNNDANLIKPMIMTAEGGGAIPAWIKSYAATLEASVRHQALSSDRSTHCHEQPTEPQRCRMFA